MDRLRDLAQRYGVDKDGGLPIVRPVPSEPSESPSPQAMSLYEPSSSPRGAAPAPEYVETRSPVVGSHPRHSQPLSSAYSVPAPRVDLPASMYHRDHRVVPPDHQRSEPDNSRAPGGQQTPHRNKPKICSHGEPERLSDRRTKRKSPVVTVAYDRCFARQLRVDRLRLRPLLTSVGAALLLASCSSGGLLADQGGPSKTSASPPTSSTTTAIPPTTTTTVPEEPGWTTLSTGPRGIAIDERTFPQPDGSQVTVARFLFNHVDYSLHVGSQDPPTANAAIGPDSGPAVSGAEQPLLLACLNGGFKVNAGAGGFEVDGQVLVPLSAGLASFVIDTAGLGQVGVWGQDVPAPGIPVTSVRQNLPPLVVGGQPSTQVADVAMWGATLGGGAVVARSALGEDAKGDLLYAASMSTLPVDLANALVTAGATSAMELDINPNWVQLATAATPGAPLVAQVPGQSRPADQCQAGWTRDFIAVLSIG